MRLWQFVCDMCFGLYSAWPRCYSRYTYVADTICAPDAVAAVLAILLFNLMFRSLQHIYTKLNSTVAKTAIRAQRAQVVSARPTECIILAISLLRHIDLQQQQLASIMECNP